MITLQEQITEQRTADLKLAATLDATETANEKKAELFEENECRLDKLHKATELVEQAQQEIDCALRGTSLVNNFEAYGRYGIDQLLGNGNPYDKSVCYLMDAIQAKQDELYCKKTGQWK